MLIESLQVEALGPFREKLVLGPFQPGLNILAQPNEWGKSTLVEALSRAFFDRYTSAAEPIRRLRPAGSTLSPQVEVIFSAPGGRFRLAKRFLDGKSCELFRWSAGAWERSDESDRADQRVRELLGAPPLGGQVVKPESWGLLRYLWARQDDPATWPSWDGASGDAARRKLAIVPIDPTVRALSAALQARAGRLFTNTGRVKAGSPLEAVQDEQTGLATELAEVRAKRAALEDLEQQHARLQAELPTLERERAEKAAEAVRSAAEAEAAEKLLETLRHLEADRSRADSALQQAVKDRETAQDLGRKATAAADERSRVATALATVEAGLAPAEQTLREAQAGQQTRGQERRAAEATLQRTRSLLGLRSQADELAKLRAARERVQSSVDELKRFEDELARLPEVTEKKLKAWRESERALREDRIRLEALGLQATLTPDQAQTITLEPSGKSLELAAGATEIVRAAQTLALRLEGWGRIEMHSGASETAALEAAVAVRETALQQALAEAHLGSLADAETAAQQARDLEQQVRTARAALKAHLGDWETLAKLDHACTKAEAGFTQEQMLLAPASDESGASMTVLQAGEQALQSALKALAREEEIVGREIDAARDRLEALRREREEARMKLATIEAQLKGLASQQEMLAQRSPAGLEAAFAEAQREFIRAEARVDEARRRLPPQAELLPARSQRAAKALAELNNDLQAKANDLRRLETRLEERGGEGLFARESELEERLETARASIARLRTEGCGARLLGELVRRHEERAIKTVLGPLESRLSEVFAGITGISNRRVWFDETLQIDGVGPRREEAVPFIDLSRGAREQLLLALRAAIALELAGETPQCLLLDDVLVHTDPTRHQNVLDYLQELAGRLQIVVLTCHADRYRGAGHLLTAVR